MAELHVHVAGYPDSDDEERAELAWRLGEEIREHGIDEVSRPAVRPPPGAKGGGLEWAQLVVSFAGVMPALIPAVMSEAALPMSIWPQAMSYLRPSSDIDLVRPVIACFVDV